tara:strand:- start:259 stop:1089 length:831 start_codon:yes stop_codon:yes gene_type:complete
MSGLTGNYTLTYSEPVQGFPSFYSYFPEMMVGMNNYLYSFKGGDLYRHNTNETRNNYYDIQYDSSITSVFNEEPVKNKIFKTIMLESDSAWQGTFTSDQQDTGSIDEDWFVKKEGNWFAFMRNTGETPAESGEYPLRSLNGISSSQTVNSAVPAAVEINFSLATSIGSILSIGDTLYFISPTPAPPPAPPSFATPTLCGTVTAININLPAGVNQIVVDTSAGNIPLGQTDYFLFIKNQIAESHGLLGHYCRFVLTNTSTTATELFTVETEVMKSFP